MKHSNASTTPRTESETYADSKDSQPSRSSGWFAGLVRSLGGKAESKAEPSYKKDHFTQDAPKSAVTRTVNGTTDNLQTQTASLDNDRTGQGERAKAEQGQELLEQQRGSQSTGQRATSEKDTGKPMDDSTSAKDTKELPPTESKSQKPKKARSSKTAGKADNEASAKKARKSRKEKKQAAKASREAKQAKGQKAEKDVAEVKGTSKMSDVKETKVAKVTKEAKDAKETKKASEQSAAKKKISRKDIPGTSLLPGSLPFDALKVEQPPVPRLAHNLDRVLFNRGVYNLQDRHSGVYNFDPYLEHVMPATEFNFDAISEYKTSSEDTFLTQTAAEHGLRYVGSTSSMTSMLTHFHYLISKWRELDLSMLSRGFKISDTKNSRNFTEIYRAPQAIFLRYKKNGTYAIDADKEFSTPNILMALGQSLEKLLTLPADVFERFRKSDPRGVPEEEMDAPQSFHYSKHGKILMRSQLDAYDPRLPGTGVFDLKTRAVLPIRMSAREFQDMTGYQINSELGTYESYEREFYDMFRSTCLKYSLQVRMGRMEGIFIAYHNVEEIFGFQFMTLAEMDRVLHGQEHPCLGDQEFRASLQIVHDILDQATAEFPETSIRLHFDTRPGLVPMMYIFAEPMTEDAVEEIQSSTKDAMVAFERELRGLPEVPSTSHPAPAAAAPEPTAPPRLLAWTLTTTSIVNGTPVPRPEPLGPNDKWELKYELTRIADAKAQAWYETTKTRRRDALDWSPDDSDASSTSSPASSAVNGKGEGKIEAKGVEGKSIAEAMAAPAPAKKKKGLSPAYMAMLRTLAQRGRAAREARAKAAPRKKVVVGFEGHGSTELGAVPGWMRKD